MVGPYAVAEPPTMYNRTTFLSLASIQVMYQYLLKTILTPVCNQRSYTCLHMMSLITSVFIRSTAP